MDYNGGMDDPPPRRKGIRLSRAAYNFRGSVVSITLCARDRKPCFRDDILCDKVICMLKQTMTSYGMGLMAYCLMPDHLHMIIHNQEGRDIVHAVRNFKAITFRIRGEPLWQRSFYDHFILAIEDLNAAIAYVLGNPVRKGLVPDRHSYPWAYPKSNGK